MSESTSIPPVLKKVLVPGSAREAFDLFTGRIDEWWPKDAFSVGGEECAQVRLEGRLGGRVYEVTTDGTEHEWGRVTSWEPGRRLAMTWYPGSTSERATAVEVTFWETSSATEVRLLHDGFVAYGEGAKDARDRYDSGWDVVLARLPHEPAAGSQPG